MRITEQVYFADDTVELFARHYEPASRNSGRKLVIAHGLMEHGGRYDHVARAIAAQGWSVAVPDLRGHGCSGGRRIHVDDFDRHAADLQCLLRRFQFSAGQTALLGHSVGGLAVVRLAERNPNCAAALVLISPLLALRVRVPRLTRALGRACAVMAPRVRFRSQVDPADTTRSQDVLERRARDPLMEGSVTAGCFFALERAVHAAWQDAGRIDLPLLICQAGDDRIVDPQAPGKWIENVASSDKTARALPGHYHELLNEPDWESTTGDILNWLESRVAGHRVEPSESVGRRV